MTASRLHARGQALEAAGKSDEAIECYLKAIAMDPRKAESHYNIGLIHKYRGEWRQSFAFNHRAHELDPSDEASRWNLAIAATALRDWAVARRMWAEEGIALTGEGPIESDFRMTPVRLNPDAKGEVVWGRRIDPVRVRIENIPFPESGFRHRDVVLHDGAPVGTRTSGGRDYSVFNVLALFERSDFATFTTEIEIADESDIAALEELFEREGCSVEDWTRNVVPICRKCSEGHPHEDHDRDLEEQWRPRRHVGIAAPPSVEVEALFTQWSGERGRRLVAIGSAAIADRGSDDRAE
jgi:tetratricopeptide (TPR) repeat protein